MARKPSGKPPSHRIQVTLSDASFLGFTRFADAMNVPLATSIRAILEGSLPGILNYLVALEEPDVQKQLLLSRGASSILIEQIKAAHGSDDDPHTN